MSSKEDLLQIVEEESQTDESRHEKLVEYEGETFLVKAPTVGEELEGDEVDPDDLGPAKMTAFRIIKCVRIPETGEHLFDSDDFDKILSMKARQDGLFMRLLEACNEVMGVETDVTRARAERRVLRNVYGYLEELDEAVIDFSGDVSQMKKEMRQWISETSKQIEKAIDTGDKGNGNTEHSDA